MNKNRVIRIAKLLGTILTIIVVITIKKSKTIIFFLFKNLLTLTIPLS
jgi:hypothetical protein